MEHGRTVADLPLAQPVRVEEGARVRDALALVREAGPGPCAGIALVSQGRLRGVIELGELLRAPGGTEAEGLVTRPTVSARPTEPAEHMVNRAAHAGARCVWVTDADGGLIGVVGPETIAATLVAEHDQDLARLGGYRSAGSGARRAAEEPVARRLMHRLPWLLIGLAGAMASAVIVSSFEEQLREVVLLSFFVPAVVYMADSVGTQTETVLIRSMAAGGSVRDMLWRELATGLALGGVVALLFTPFAALGWGDTSVAVAVGLALMASCSIATVVAMALPALFQRFGRDPAFGSGPLATVIQDLLSIAIYFVVAVPLAT